MVSTLVYRSVEILSMLLFLAAICSRCFMKSRNSDRVSYKDARVSRRQLILRDHLQSIRSIESLQ
jgi:hypothetical protein